eukprot:TRINITY_DN32566_c0_g1_i1.p1 TRINITY_DN32566_c0_g1~~TRINITY_DN32566_c0_g1_i1.p1  ORF type:complete len:384 (+),score=14.39 TRINITY_DN32566_c0_g1_i1:25-1152(+)
MAAAEYGFGALCLVIGLPLLFLGLRFAEHVRPLAGFAIGFGGGALLGHVILADSLITFSVGAAVGAVLLTYLAYRIYPVGVVLVGFYFGALLGLAAYFSGVLALANGNDLSYNYASLALCGGIPGIASGLLTLKRFRLMVALSTSAVGASLVSAASFYFFTGNSACESRILCGLGLSAAATLTLVAFVVQIYVTGKSTLEKHPILMTTGSDHLHSSIQDIEPPLPIGSFLPPSLISSVAPPVKVLDESTQPQPVNNKKPKSTQPATPQQPLLAPPVRPPLPAVPPTAANSLPDTRGRPPNATNPAYGAMGASVPTAHGTSAVTLFAVPTSAKTFPLPPPPTMPPPRLPVPTEFTACGSCGAPSPGLFCPECGKKI